jgi:integrase/recombinase XerC
MNNVAGRLEKEIQFYDNLKQKLKGAPSIIGEYCNSLRANRKSYTTVGVYFNNVLHFARFIGGGELTENFYQDIAPSDIENYMISLETRETSDGIKRTGDDILQARWSSLNTFFNWALKRGYITENPMNTVSRPKNNTEHKVTYLNKVEINKLFRAIDKNPDKVMAVRDRTLISLALATALRVSALVNINVDDVDFDNNVIKVIEKRQKIREISIGDNTKEMLEKWMRLREEEFGHLNMPALFISRKHNRLSIFTVGDLLEKYCDEAGIKRITPHKLRASAACALAKAGLPVKAIAQQLGHNQIATTMKYVDVFNEDMEKSRGVLDNLF